MTGPAPTLGELRDVRTRLLELLDRAAAHPLEPSALRALGEALESEGYAAADAYARVVRDALAQPQRCRRGAAR